MVGWSGRILRFGQYRLEVDRALLRDGEVLPLGQRALAVLAALLSKPGRVVSKDELMAAAWPGLSVEDSNLTTQIWTLRQALEDQERPHRWIITVPGRGYRANAAVQVELPGAAGDTVSAGNLPVPMDRMFGRAADIEALCAAFGHHRLVSVQGPGGIGKTRLAIESARRLVPEFPGGVYFVDLAVLRDGGLVATAVARALGVSLSSDTPPLDAVIRHVADRRLLIVLDNCEHVADAAAAFAEALLGGASGAHLLATSREPLACRGERLLSLSPLAVPTGDPAGAPAALATASVALLVDRIQAIDLHFALSDDQAAAAASICRKLDGLPLAIEMVGAWVPVFDLPGVAARLDAALPSSSRRTAPARHRSIDAALDWSHALLSYEERLGLRRLAVFPGAFTLEAAEAVIGDAEMPARQVGEILLALHRKSLVTVVAADVAPAFRLLETTRAYAHSKLVAAGEAQALRRLHARFVTARLLQAEADWENAADQVWIDRYGPDLDDVRTALDWAFAPGGERELGLIALGRSWPLWAMLSLHSEGRRRLAATLPLIGADTPPAVEASLQLGYGIFTSERAFETGRQALRRAAELFHAAGDPTSSGFALAGLGQLLAMYERTEEAVAVLSEARALLAGSGRRKPLATCAVAFGRVHVGAGNWAAARQEYETAAALYGAIGADRLLAATLLNLADAIWQQGDLDAAVEAGRRAVAQARQSGSPAQLGGTLSNLAGILIARGDLGEALSIAGEAMPLARDDDYATPLLDHLAALAGKAGRFENAARLWGYTDAELARRGNPRQPNEQQAIDDLARCLGAALAVPELARLQAEGAQMSEDQAVALALA